jgi:hypothetical protein
MIINFDALKATDLDLYKIVTDWVGLAFTGQDELQPVEIAALTPAMRRRLSDWQAQQPPTRWPRLHHRPSEPLPEQIKMSEVEEEQRQDVQRSVDVARATQQLKEWQDAGLEDTENNANLIREFVNNSAVKGYWSSEIVDAAIANLGPGKGTNQLTWKPKEAPPAEPPPEPTEVLENWQLPLDSDEYAMKRASVRALKDLVARRRAATTGKYIRPRGTFGSSIF